MSLINNDLKTNFAEAREQLFAALRTDNEQEQKQAFENFVTGLEANVSEQVKAAAAEFHKECKMNQSLPNVGFVGN